MCLYQPPVKRLSRGGGGAACLLTTAPSSNHLMLQHSQSMDRLVGPVVKASDSKTEDPGFESRLRRDFSRSSHACDLKIGTQVATLLGAWRYRVSAGTGWPGVSIL